MSYSLGDNARSSASGIHPMTCLTSTVSNLDTDPRLVPELWEDTLHPSQVLEWLQCPLCVTSGAQSTLLNRPITLRCGHSLCSHHFSPSSPQAPLCPVQGCPRVFTFFSDGPIALKLATSPAGGPPVGTDVRLAQIVTLALESAPIFSTGSPKQALSRLNRPETGQGQRTSQQQQQRAVGPGLDHGLPIDNGRLDTIPPADRRRNRPENHEKTTGLPCEASSKYIRSLLALTMCAICLNPLVDPITTCCQHTFCSECLFRALDHSPNCPICRHQFNNVAEFYEYGVNRILATILSAVASTPTPLERQGSDLELDMPIFVCQLSFPGMLTILHIFEPRYRLMLRRVLASRKPRFGMIMYPTQEGLTVNYGTMLEVSNIHILADGRSIVQTMGTYRFKITKRKEMDGYLHAKVERVDDLSAAMEMELEKNATLLIPPRTPPILPTLPSPPLPGPKPIEVVGSQGELQHTTNDTTISLLQSRIRRRSNSPSPSITSVATISTLSSIRSAPPSSSNSNPGYQFQRPSLMRMGRGRGSVGNNRTTDIQGIPVLNSLRSTYSETGTRAPPTPMFTYPIEPSTEELIATCQAFVHRLRSGSSQHVRDRLSRVGPVPTDSALLSFWIAQLLPIDEGEKAKLLPIRSPRLRLRLVVHWIDQFNAAWSFSGCVVS